MTNTHDLSKGEIIIYKSEGKSNLEVIQQDNTLWLSTEKISKLFGKDRTTIQRHISKIYQEEELDKDSTCAFIAQVQKEGKRTVSRKIDEKRADSNRSTPSCSFVPKGWLKSTYALLTTGTFSLYNIFIEKSM